MACFGRLGIGLSIGFGVLLLAFGAEVYYLLWRKKRITVSPTPETKSPSPDYTHSARELLIQLIRWKKPNPADDRIPDVKEGEDLELGTGKDSDSVAKQFVGEESVESELMRLHNLSGPPRFLFTIKEETREDLESDDGRSRKGSRARSLSDLILSLDTPFLTPLPSPPLKASSLNNESPLLDSYNNPLFEYSGPMRPPASPPPKFKFLRDAEEKLYRRLKEEAEAVLMRGTLNKSGAQSQKVTAPSSSSQVLPLESSPTVLRPAPDKKTVVR
ncbi:uncharacterized protein LOC116212020 [Punica granatum]|uniref:Uncharacterized protein n=2 Tax=Punica granatum TaxID=22663 RepID=A0A218W9C6_PUNGR|nr:uncharacterized protein LOC116212020 [Punica granatum]OWM68811.1 hypothetical protein CDL15_Pgr024998 [Punica granatum]PKI36428.1 hypothetical protein CRG98_043210 [Punica granatum]